MSCDMKFLIKKNNLKEISIAKEEKVRWFFDGEEYVFTKQEESFFKKVAPKFFLKQ